MCCIMLAFVVNKNCHTIIRRALSAWTAAVGPHEIHRVVQRCIGPKHLPE